MELSKTVALTAILFIVVIALAGLGLVVVNALAESPWGTFTVGFTIPLALFMGLYMYKFRKGKITEATIIGVIGLLFAVWLGGKIAESSWAATFTLSPNKVSVIMAAYGFIASVLPVWMLLCPRDYLSSYLKIGTIFFLIIGVILVHPTLNMPAWTPFVAGGGPVIPGKVYPFVFITIACGAISGFHALISSGTTPKMIAKETDARMIGYGSMLMEGVVGVVALIAATSLFPGDYFAINTAQKTDSQKAAYTQMVDHHTGVWQCRSFLVSARREQNGAHGSRQTGADRSDLWVDVLHGVIDPQACINRSARTVDIHDNIFSGVG